MKMIDSICVYCGSSPGRNGAYTEAGYKLGRAIATAGLRLVYGGGTRGIMGAVSRGALEAGGKVTGIIPRFLIDKEAPDNGDALDELIVTDNMHQRKHAMFEKSDAFVTLPGGIGTLEEIVEMMTWAQLGHHAKPMVFGNIDGFWSPMIGLIDHMKAQGFIHTANKVRPLVIDTIDEIVPAILATTRELRPEGADAVIGKL